MYTDRSVDLSARRKYFNVLLTNAEAGVRRTVPIKTAVPHRGGV